MKAGISLPLLQIDGNAYGKPTQIWGRELSS
jgi:hypothetical protein